MTMIRRVSTSVLKSPVKLPTITCPKPECGYTWHPNVPAPKKCPYCQWRLDRPLPHAK